MPFETHEFELSPLLGPHAQRVLAREKDAGNVLSFNIGSHSVTTRIRQERRKGIVEACTTPARAGGTPTVGSSLAGVD